MFENALEGSQLLNYLTASAPLLDWCKVLIKALREVNHHVLAALRQLPHTPARRPRIPGKNISQKSTLSPAKCRDNSLWRQDGAVLYVTTISDGATPSNHTVLTCMRYCQEEIGCGDVGRAHQCKHKS